MDNIIRVLYCIFMKHKLTITMMAKINRQRVIVMKVIIDDSNSYLKEGLVQILHQCYDENIDFIQPASDVDLKSADVAFYRFDPGDEHICHARYLERSNCVLVGIAEETPSISALPLCIKKTIFLTKNDTVASFQKRLSFAIKNKENNRLIVKDGDYSHLCNYCTMKKITTTEFTILNYLLCDMPVRKVAEELGVPYKTAYSRKYNIMLKFNLKNNIDLFLFIQKHSRDNNFTLSPKENAYYLIKR